MICLLEDPRRQYNLYLNDRSMTDNEEEKIEDKKSKKNVRNVIVKALNENKSKKNEGQVVDKYESHLLFEEFVQRRFNCILQRLKYCNKIFYVTVADKGIEQVSEENDQRFGHLMKSSFVRGDCLSFLFVSLATAKESVRTKKKVKVGIISPYKAQVYAIGEKVKNYSVDSNDDFSISFSSVDGFQGGEEDVIIISIVRCNMNGVVGFPENCQRVNVALSCARYFLWILGNEATLTKSCTIWKELVIDAKKRGHFYNADVDKSLAQAITVALVEHNQIQILLYMDSFLFREAKWKVSFSNDFLKSMSRAKNAETCKQVLTLLENLANGWRQSHRKKNLFFYQGTSQLLEQYKVWNILPLSEIPRVTNHLDALFENYKSVCTKKKVKVGIISPYKAQVFAIGEKVKNYSADINEDFSISVCSVDGFQGGDEDVIIVSNGVVGFLKNHQRANVALIRARHAFTLQAFLWILGNEVTLNKRCTIWKDLVIDAKKRGCFYNADEDKSFAQAITVALVEHNQIHILLNMDSFLFKKAQWKNMCCGNLTQSFICYRSLVVPMRWPIGSNSCTEANPVQSLLEPLASLSLRYDSDSSSTTFSIEKLYYV
ncbi:putative helicase magatama 3 [Quercus suber]|uniref:Helicase magatama 3 n=1 Tax=Quercus suber TaxID=58331 RepID=A0AAW0ISV0_QUESU